MVTDDPKFLKSLIASQVEVFYATIDLIESLNSIEDVKLICEATRNKLNEDILPYIIDKT